jgi:L-asparaginase
MLQPPALTSTSHTTRHAGSPSSTPPSAATPSPGPRADLLPLRPRNATDPTTGAEAPAPRRKLRLGDHKFNVEIPFTTRKPKDELLYIATGGTISATGSRYTYDAGALTGEECLQGVRRPHNVNVTVANLFAKDSKDIEARDWHRLRDFILQKIDSVRGIVVSHGTDTLALTASYLHWTIPPQALEGKKVVLTGAMLPASEPHRDGPANLSDAFFLARSRKAQGVLTTLGGAIYAPPDFAKKHTTSAQAFQPVDQRQVGTIRNGKVSLTQAPHPAPRTFQPAHPEELPIVNVIPAEPGVPPSNTVRRIRDAIAADAQGIVYAGTGNGTIHKDVAAELSRQAAAGHLIVRASGVGDGEVIRNGAFPDDEHRIACAGRLMPDQARLLAQLALDEARHAAAPDTPLDLAALHSVFDPYQSQAAKAPRRAGS